MEDKRVSEGVYRHDRLEVQESEPARESGVASSNTLRSKFVARTWLPFALTQSAFTFGSAD